jgi:uncharacterized protein YcnI
MIGSHRRYRMGLAAAAALVLAPAVADAHAVIYPKRSVAGGYEKYILRVPNERDVPTTRVELRFPAGLRVEAFADVPGWQLQVITDSAKAITGAIWTGTLAPKRFVEFPFEAANPKSDARLAWPTYQTYSNGERVEWTGPEHTKTPAPVTTIEGASIAASIGPSAWVSGSALLLALISLGLVMRRRELHAS